jgi:preprotein translocase subunit SecF
MSDSQSGFHFDFVRWRNVAALFSLALVALSWLAFFVIGPNWGIDFTGGTEIKVAFEQPIEIGELRSSLEQLSLPADAVQEIGDPSQHAFKIRIKDPEFGADEVKQQVVAALKAKMGEGWVADWDKDVVFSSEVGARFLVHYTGPRTLPEQVLPALQDLQGVKVDEGREENELVIKLPGLEQQIQREISRAMGERKLKVLAVDAVGPRVGESLRQQAAVSVVFALLLILVYVGFRFELTFAPGAVLSLLHDLSVTIGVFVLLGRELNLEFVAALLTILGYSLNDTIVIFDRIREMRPQYARDDIAPLINQAVNDTLTRTLATNFCTLVMVTPFLFLGTEVIRDFTFAIFLGVFFGTYSTIYVASTMILATEKARPWIERVFAVQSGDEDEEDDVPEAFLSESEKRRRERAKLEKARSGDDAP